MDTGQFTELLFFTGVIPVVALDDSTQALPLAEALLAGGIPLVEITLRTEAAPGAIRAIALHQPGVIVGAGSVLTPLQAQQAADAGAKFIVSPGMADEVVVWAQDHQIPVLAGAVTPTEMMRAMRLGLDTLKFFPSETMGGLKAIKAISDPFPQLKFIPTGGIRLENMAEYLNADRIVAVGGSWMATRAMIADRKFGEIQERASQACQVVKYIRKRSET